MKKALVSGVAAVLASAVALPTAWGYRVLEKDGVPVGWPSGTELGFELLENYPGLLPAEAVRTQIFEAMQLWNARVACNAPPMSVIGPAAGPPQSGDGKNTIAWVHSDWAGTTGASIGSPAVTDIRISTDENGVYHIVEADLYLNAEQFQWTTDLSAAGAVSGSQVQYLKEDIAHELGHTAGIDHSCEFEPPAGVPDCSSGAYAATLMFPNPRYVEPAIATDDSAGLCSLYQDSSTTTDPATGETLRQLVPEGGDCKKHEQCQPGTACIEGKCAFGNAAPGDLCVVHAQCESQRCVNGGCRADCSTGHSCTYAGQACDAATSSCAVEVGVFGDRCDAAADCASAQCAIESAAESYCTKLCSFSDECPSGWECTAIDGRNVCRQPPPSGDGCSISTTLRDSGRSKLIALLLGLCLFGLRLRRHQRMGEN